MIIISAPMTIKQIMGIERGNFRQKKESPIIFDSNALHPQSPAGIYILGEYYRKLEKSPNLAVSTPELMAIKKVSSVNGQITCYHCQRETDSNKITIDHFLPTYLGGQVTLSNLRLSCYSCNTMKGSIHPVMMPNCWNQYKQQIESKKWISSIELLCQVENSGQCDKSELHLINKIVRKEIQWRLESEKELPLLERLNLLSVFPKVLIEASIKVS